MEDNNVISDSINAKDLSYFLAVFEKYDNFMEGIFDRIAKIDGVEIKRTRDLSDEGPAMVSLVYKGIEYDIGFYPSDFSVSDFRLGGAYYFSEEELVRIEKSKMGLMIFMEFNDDAKESFHLQLKLAISMVPNLVCLCDLNAERIFPLKWVRLAASSSVVPNSSDLFGVQIVTDDGKAWLHTHGLSRCGITDLEILQVDKNKSNIYYPVISSYASYLLDNREANSFYKGSYIGVLFNKQRIVVTCVPWNKGLDEYKDLRLGNAEDRVDTHNYNTSLIFIYKNEDDEQNRVLSKVSEYDDLWASNPIFFLSKEETSIRKALAQERFDYVKSEALNQENDILIKISFIINDGASREHLWFKLIEFAGDKFKAELTQESYYDIGMNVGDCKWFSLADVSDWIIYRSTFAVRPNNVYRLD